MKRRRMLIPLVALLLGCVPAVGGQPLESIPTPLPPEQRVEVRSDGKRFQLHAVTIDADSLRGVFWWKSPDCDSCRVSLTRGAVSSVLLVEGSIEGDNAVGLVAGLAAVVLIILTFPSLRN